MQNRLPHMPKGGGLAEAIKAAKLRAYMEISLLSPWQDVINID